MINKVITNETRKKKKKRNPYKPGYKNKVKGGIK